MTSITKEFLSNSTNGRHINLTTSGTPGTLIHTATSMADQKDEVWLYANNTFASTANLTVEWGGTNNPDDLLQVGIPSQQGDVLVVAGKPLAGGVAVRAYSDATAAASSGINISGWVNRIDANG